MHSDSTVDGHEFDFVCRENIVKLVVYYEDLMEETMEEKASFDLTALFGEVLGLRCIGTL